MSGLTLSGLPAAKAERVARAARRAFHDHLPLQDGAFAFAGVLQPIGNGTTDLVLAISHEDTDRLIDLAYALLMRACANAEASGDDFTAECAGDALEVLDDLIGEPAVPQRAPHLRSRSPPRSAPRTPPSPAPTKARTPKRFQASIWRRTTAPPTRASNRAPASMR